MLHTVTEEAPRHASHAVAAEDLVPSSAAALFHHRPLILVPAWTVGNAVADPGAWYAARRGDAGELARTIARHRHVLVLAAAAVDDAIVDVMPRYAASRHRAPPLVVVAPAVVERRRFVLAVRTVVDAVHKPATGQAPAARPAAELGALVARSEPLSLVAVVVDLRL